MTRLKAGKQLKFKSVCGWGGRRPRAGRPNLSGQVNHIPVLLKTPLHVTLRLKEKLPSIRTKDLFKEFKESAALSKKQGLHIIHFSIQRNHIHLFCESRSNRSLPLGMRSLAGRFGKILRAYPRSRGGGKSGSTFDGRYHLHVLKTPREVKNTLEYVLLNSSAHAFRYWPKLLGSRFKSLIKADAGFFENQQKPIDLKSALCEPQSWLAKAGWMRACAQCAVFA